MEVLQGINLSVQLLHPSLKNHDASCTIPNRDCHGMEIRHGNIECSGHQGFGGQRQHGGLRDDSHTLPYGSDTCKRTWDNYETARKASDLENETVVERYHARLQDNHHCIPSGCPQSHPPPPIASTFRSQLPAHSSHAPVSRRSGSSLRHHHLCARSPRFRPASPNRRPIIDVDEVDEDEYN
ncbi:uncharacterized protein F5891DRAFT_1199408 [Suillus fuscotomentosus]|uniref:Uncharacterized protein n=1 Tax=Suillus fuscotomentosus TaxID=1912939 RepID=A0AAD4DPE3_9AGAM|nr:uncharacterized protein F5891DRAFT_1199408 [Suillus fuscotomentosus]KAG1887971.1 hypothetical protein F5891DRAFT_1199408 [Suillus fuscotomentosus]